MGIGTLIHCTEMGAVFEMWIRRAQSRYAYHQFSHAERGNHAVDRRN